MLTVSKLITSSQDSFFVGPLGKDLLFKFSIPWTNTVSMQRDRGVCLRLGKKAPHDLRFM